MTALTREQVEHWLRTSEDDGTCVHALAADWIAQREEIERAEQYVIGEQYTSDTVTNPIDALIEIATERGRQYESVASQLAAKDAEIERLTNLLSCANRADGTAIADENDRLRAQIAKLQAVAEHQRIQFKLLLLLHTERMWDSGNYTEEQVRKAENSWLAALSEPEQKEEPDGCSGSVE